VHKGFEVKQYLVEAKVRRWSRGGGEFQAWLCFRMCPWVTGYWASTMCSWARKERSKFDSFVCVCVLTSTYDVGSHWLSFLDLCDNFFKAWDRQVSAICF